MNEQQQKFAQYLDEQISACRQRSELLAGDNRMDERNFEKIRGNIYEIFKTILSTAEGIHGEDNLSKRRFFLQKTEQIPANWVTSHEKAKQHGDVEKIHIERIKLDTVREIKDMCVQIWEETT